MEPCPRVRTVDLAAHPERVDVAQLDLGDGGEQRLFGEGLGADLQARSVHAAGHRHRRPHAHRQRPEGGDGGAGQHSQMYLEGAIASEPVLASREDRTPRPLGAEAHNLDDCRASGAASSRLDGSDEVVPPGRQIEREDDGADRTAGGSIRYTYWCGEKSLRVGASCLQSRDARIRASEEGRQGDEMLGIVGRHARAVSRPMQRYNLTGMPSVQQRFGLSAAGEPELLVANSDSRTGGRAGGYENRRHQRGGRDLPVDAHRHQYECWPGDEEGPTSLGWLRPVSANVPRR